MQPGPPRDHTQLIERFVGLCSTDDRIAAAFVSGSTARGEADAYSDLDLGVIATDERYAEVVAGKADLVRALGDPLFIEDFGQDDNVLFILADGTDGELFVGRAGALNEIHVGPFRTLVDPGGILDGAEFPFEPADRAARAENASRILAWFWHELSHLVTAIGRNELWWAAGQLEAVRTMCVNLMRLDLGDGYEEAYWKIDDSISTDLLEPLRTTFVPLELDAIRPAAAELLAFFRARAPDVAAHMGLTYPRELDAMLSARLEALGGR